jgi:uncharacterized protein (DUF427 family)
MTDSPDDEPRSHSMLDTYPTSRGSTPTMMRRIAPGPGQESVWDYPRPPRLETVPHRLRVVFNGVTLADTQHAFRVLETSHPPAYYLPQADLRMEFLTLVPSYRTFCEFKGSAVYWDIQVEGKGSRKAAWSYPQPSPGFEPIRDHLAFYASRVDACFVDDEQVQAQAGDFYGGWITRAIVGPFKGGVGTFGW